MASIHRQDDLRECGATTIAIGQDFVKISNKLASVVGDLSSHGAGVLIAGLNTFVKINNKLVIVVGDTATSDGEGHNPPLVNAATGSEFVMIRI